MTRTARRAGWILWGILAAALPLGAQSGAGPIAPKPGVPVQQAPREKVPTIIRKVILVNTPVTVRNEHGEMLTDLERNEFRVFDNGVEQFITHFDVGGDPLSIVIVVENSSRIRPLLKVVRKTGILFTQNVMGQTGEAAVLSVNDSIDKLADFTGDADQIEKTFAGMKEGTSGLRLYDAMATAVEMLQSRPMSSTGEGRRRVLVVLSEGEDKGSESKLGSVLKQAQLANVAIYSVGLSTTRAELQAEPKDHTVQVSPPGTFPLPPTPGTPQTPTSEQQRYGGADLGALVAWVVTHVEAKVKAPPLQVATAGTGGANYNTYKDASIEAAIDKIGGELHAQYSLSYTLKGVAPEGYHEIRVQVLRHGTTWRARPGYYLGS
jgi:VWFA-related protein